MMIKASPQKVAGSPFKVALRTNTILHNFLDRFWLVSYITVTISDSAVVKRLSEMSVRSEF